MIKEDLNKAIDLQEEFGNPCIVIHKPRAKEKFQEYDSDSMAFGICNDEVVFDFWSMEGFTVKLNKIKSILFEKFSDTMTIVHICLKYGKEVMLLFVK